MEESLRGGMLVSRSLIQVESTSSSSHVIFYLCREHFIHNIHEHIGVCPMVGTMRKKIQGCMLVIFGLS